MGQQPSIKPYFKCGEPIPSEWQLLSRSSEKTYTDDFLCKKAYIQNYTIGKATSGKFFRLYFSKVWVNSYRLNPNSNVESAYLANGNYFHEVRKRHILTIFSARRPTYKTTPSARRQAENFSDCIFLRCGSIAIG